MNTSHHEATEIVKHAANLQQHTSYDYSVNKLLLSNDTMYILIQNCSPPLSVRLNGFETQVFLCSLFHIYDIYSGKSIYSPTPPLAKVFIHPPLPSS